MSLNTLHCFIPQLTVLILFIAETDQNTADGEASVSRADDAFLSHIFKFLYNNEQLCGDVFAEPQWLPAQSDCQISCPVTEGLCLTYVNLSDNGAQIQKQKCRYLAPDCTMKLQRLLVASALTSTTPTATTHVITITNTTMHDLTAASKHYNGWNKGKDKLDKRHHANRSHSSAGSDTTIPPAVGSWSGFSGKHKRVNLKQNFTETSNKQQADE